MAWITRAFQCDCGKRFEDLVKSEDIFADCPECGQPSPKAFVPTTASYVPPYNRAPGSVGSSSDFCDRNKVWLGSQDHVRMRQQAERIEQRTAGVEASFEKHLKEAAANLTEDKVLARAEKIGEAQAKAAQADRKVKVA